MVIPSRFYRIYKLGTAFKKIKRQDSRPAILLFYFWSLGGYFRRVRASKVKPRKLFPRVRASKVKPRKLFPRVRASKVNSEGQSLVNYFLSGSFSKKTGVNPERSPRTLPSESLSFTIKVTLYSRPSCRVSMALRNFFFF